MGYTDTLGKALRVFLNPKAATSNSMSVGDSLKFYYKLMPIPLVLGLIVSFLVAKFIAPLAGYGIVAMIAVYFIIGFPLGILIDGGIYHVIIGKLFKLYRGNYSRITTAFAYSIIPMLFTGWLSLPLIASAGGHMHAVTISLAYAAGVVLVAIFSIWSFVTLLFGLSNQLKISKLKAFGTLLLNWLIVLVITFAIVFTFGVAFLGSAGAL